MPWHSKGWNRSAWKQAGAAAPPTPSGETFNINDAHPSFTFSGGNLVATAASNTAGTTAYCAGSFSAGDYYCEADITHGDGATGDWGFGVGPSNRDVGTWLGRDISQGLYCDGTFWSNSALVGSPSFGALVDTTNVGLLFRFGLQKWWIRINGGNWDGNASHDPMNNVGGIDFSIINKPTAKIGFTASLAGMICTMRFSSSSWAHAAPVGSLQFP